MRWIISALVFLAACGYGLLYSGGLKKRCLLLRELRSMVSEMAVAIRYTAPTLEELCGGIGGVFGELIRQELSAGKDIRTAWADSTDRLSGCGFTEKAEAEILTELGRSLGTSGWEGQMSLLGLCGERLDKLLCEAEEISGKKGRLMRSVSALSGLGLAILIL